MRPEAFDRADAVRRLETSEFDVLIVGGGITGLGCALDAASRGLRTALVERDDFSSGTSSKSSKLVHGGIRYLQQGEVRLVYEALAERKVLRRNAPHLVSVLPFLIPIFSKSGVVPKQLARAMGSAMWMYDLTGGIRIGKVHKRVSKQEALEEFPTLRAEHLMPSYIYYDAEADDSRLCITVARTAALDHGAVLVNRAAVTALHKDAAGRVTGASVEVDGRTIDVSARSIVSATGVWADHLATLDDPNHRPMIRPAKGIHITVPWTKVRNRIAAVIPVPGDRRSVFVVPWGRFTFIGTTDTDYDGPIDDPQCTADDIEYLLRAINGAITEPVTADDIVGTWAGLRPLVADPEASGRTADLSRRHKVTVSDSGVVTITGGKLTTYRRMAADTIDAVVRRLDDRASSRFTRRSRTKRLHLHGADGHEALLDRADSTSALGGDVVRHLVHRYGTDATAVLALAESDPDLARPLVPGLPYLRAEAVHAVRNEMATTLTDVLARRTRALLQSRDASLAAAPEVALLLAGELGWDESETTRQVADYAGIVEEERRSMADA